jgi:hypothetical protein
MATTFINHMTISILQENRDLARKIYETKCKNVHYECQKIKTKEIAKISLI